MVNGLIAAGWRSERMSRDKALLPAGGVPLIAVLLMRMAHCARIVIAAGSAVRTQTYRAALKPMQQNDTVPAGRLAFALDRRTR
jgi:molybdopterin-guanine dinucleotide biosynthesis protein A